MVISLAVNGIGLNDPTNHGSEKPQCSLYGNARVSVCVCVLHAWTCTCPLADMSSASVGSSRPLMQPVQPSA